MACLCMAARNTSSASDLFAMARMSVHGKYYHAVESFEHVAPDI